jgi:hypothetical protein
VLTRNPANGRGQVGDSTGGEEVIRDIMGILNQTDAATHLIVEQRLDERLRGPCSTTRLALVRTDWIKRVNGASTCVLIAPELSACLARAKKRIKHTIFLNTAEDVVNIVREEALGVQHCLN